MSHVRPQPSALVRGAISAEVRALLHIRSTASLLVVTTAAFVLLALGRSFTTEQVVVESVGSAVSFGADTAPLGAALFAVVAVAGDFTRSAVVYPILVRPSRAQLIGIKTVAVAGMAMITAAIAAAVTVVACSAVLAHAGLLQFIPTLAAAALPTGIFVAVSGAYACMGVGVGYALRSTAGAVFVLLALVWVVPIVATVLVLLNGRLGAAALQGSPAALTATAVEATVASGPAMLGLVAWVAALLLLGWLRFRRFSPA